MNTRYRILAAIIIILIIWRSAYHFSSLRSETQEGQADSDSKDTIEKVTVSVYYEALCPDSKFFVINQLLPVYESIQDYTIVDLVPYGKAQTKEFNGKLVFQCQHDEVECEANKIHACVVKYVADPLIRLKYIACMISQNIIPDEIAKTCGKKLNVDATPILECANSLTGSLLLKEYGERTHSLNPPVSFIPTIELNGSQTQVRQSLILKNLLKAVCQLIKNPPYSCL